MPNDQAAVEELVRKLTGLLDDIDALKGDRRDEIGRLLSIARTQLQLVRGFVYAEILTIQIYKYLLFSRAAPTKTE